MKFKLALAQIDPVLGNVAANVKKHVAMATRARALGANLVVFPELSLTGYSIKDMNWDLAIRPDIPPKELAPLFKLSKSISILAGGVEEDKHFRLFNSAFLFEDGALSVAHRKVYPPTYGMFEEMRYFNRGESARAIDTKHGRIGVLICEDLWHPALPYIQAQDGAGIVIALVASPTRVGGDEKELPIAVANSENHKAYARLLTTYIAFCNRVGYEDGVNFWGGSSIAGPDGELVVAAKQFDEDLILATIDENDVRRARRFSRHFLDDDMDLVVRELNRIRQHQQ
ncbi:MAG: nitrilase-related carbon-nitrogen hydrolase [Bacteroidota bacterium]